MTASPHLIPRENAARATLPRLLVNQEEAAAMLGMSVDAFVEHVRPELRIVRRGRLRRYPVRGLERWVEENATRALEDAR